MPHPDTAIVTGAFSYTGRYITRRLLDEGVRVRTLTGHPNRRDPFGGQVEVAPLEFSDLSGLRRSMQGAGVLYNTYWVRFERGRTTFDRAVKNSNALFEAAAMAGISRIVHISVSNASSGSRLPYFRGKGRVEESLKDLGVPYAIIRPTLTFGAGDLLMNNMAWALRRFPFFPIYGRGDYPVQPIFAGDIADQAVDAASRADNSVSDAAGPETLSFEALLRLLADTMGVRSRFVHTPPSLGLNLTRLVGLMMRDVVLTRDEVDGLMAGLLTSDAAPTGKTSLSSWLEDNAHRLGLRYASELNRHFDSKSPA